MAHDERQRRVNEYLETLKKKIKEHGWVVFPTKDEDGARFAYTVGLTVIGLPELLITGNLDFELHEQLLNDAAQEHLRKTLEPGDLVTDIASVIFKVAQCGPDAPVQQARNLYGDRVTALQLIWPDKNGAYPGTFRWSLKPEDQPLY